MKRISSLLTAAAFTALTACSHHPTGPQLTMENVAGTYTLWDLAHTDQSGTTHYGPPDSHINLVLAVDGTVTGDMLIKGGASGGGDFSADMSGTWRIDHFNVRFDQTADTFVRDMGFLFVRGRLTGLLETQSGTTSVQLQQQ